MKPADTAPAPLPKVEPSDRLGAVVPAPTPAALDGADLTNVIVLAHRRSPGGTEAPAVSVSDKERPAPATPWTDRVPWTALIAGALLLHLALVLTFLREPAPMASLDLDSISVEIVLGGQTEAGIAQAPSPEQSAPSAPSTSAPEQPQQTEQQTETAEQTKPDLRPSIEPQREEPKPQEAQAAAEPGPAPTPEPEPAPVVAEAEKTAKETEPEKAKPIEEPVATQPPPQQEPVEKPREQTKPSPPRVAASQSGVGLGSSRATKDWASLVSAHLARNKRYPADALSRGVGGTAVVSFSLDGGGHASAVRLVRSSGNPSLDRESQDLVRRASPFPAPPQGKASITVPVNFNVRTGR